MTSHFCSTCSLLLKSNKYFQAHIKSKRHIARTQSPTVNSFVCGGDCRKTYTTRQGLHAHKKICTIEKVPIFSSDEIITLEDLKNSILEDRKKHQIERDEYLKDRDEYLKKQEEHEKQHEEMKAQIAILLDKQSHSTTNNINSHNNTNSHNNNTNHTTINAFGNENTDCIMVPEPTHESVNTIMQCTHNKEHDIVQKQIDCYKEERIEMQTKMDNLTKTHIIQSETHQHPSRGKRKHIKKGTRQKIVDKQGNLCGDCKLTLTPFFQIDHVIGIQFGGTDEESNLMALCCECHAKKSVTENRCRKRIKDAILVILKETQNMERY